MPASQRAAPSEALISNTAIVAPPDAQNSPHITTPSKVEPNWRKSNRTIEMINEVIISPSSTSGAEAADILIQRHHARRCASRR